jgi:dihydropteroate synthase
MQPTIHIMGVINVTPDSFSDGGAYLDPGAAVAHAEQLVADGATVLDLGAEATRPGAAPVDAAEEWRRLAPVLAALASRRLGAVLSVDTSKAEIMLRAADAGAAMINDVTGTADAATLARLARYPRMAYVAMHMHGEPRTMQRSPLAAADAVATVEQFFARCAKALADAGFEPDRRWLDPGIGFGKSDGANLRLMAATADWASRYQLAVGVSRKSLLGRALGIATPADRDAPSKTLELALAMAGARMIRTHDVKRLKHLLDLWHTGM